MADVLVGLRQLVEVDRRGRVRRALQLDGWTRGLVVHDDILFVGVSANRNDRGAGGTASIVAVDRKRLKVVDRITLPCREVYDRRALPDRQRCAAS